MAVTFPYVAGSVFPLNKVQLDLELPKGNYEVSFIGSTFTFHIVQAGIDYSDAMFSSHGVVEMLGVNQPGSWNYPAVNPSHLGAYNWIFKAGAAGACGRATADVTADCGITTEVIELTKGSINVYPNPASDVLNIDLKAINAENSFIELYNAVGQQVLSKNVSSVSGDITQLNTANFDNGLYLVKVLAEGKIYTQSVVITK